MVKKIQTMTNEELMRPRYKVIADWPGNKIPIGEVCTISSNQCGVIYGLIYHISMLDKHPHLFKKLEWWERRNVEDLPEYLRCSKTIGKVKEYGWFKGGNSAKFENDTTEYLSHCEPATKEEYEAYQLTK